MLRPQRHPARLQLGLVRWQQQDSKMNTQAVGSPALPARFLADPKLLAAAAWSTPLETQGSEELSGGSPERLQVENQGQKISTSQWTFQP
jgi:hypothetical protein